MAVQYSIMRAAACIVLLMAVASEAVTHTVLMGVPTSNGGSLNVFQPASLTVKVGDNIKFVENVAFPKPYGHNVHFTRAPLGVTTTQLATFSHLGIFSTKGTFYVTPKFVKAGKYTYDCQPHATIGMKGTIYVMPATGR